MEQKKYWQSFTELNQDAESFKKLAQDEFREELPFEMDEKGILDAKAPRRDFLKFLGFSTAAATLAASCEVPVKKAVPFLNKPEDIVPGVANWYATTYVNDGEVIPVLAKVRDGRPIKIEGNDTSFTKGGTSAKVQASVLGLYDIARLRFPLEDGKEAPSYDAIDKKITEALAGIGSKQIVILTSTLNSPSLSTVIEGFVAKYPSAKHVMYDAISYSGMLDANLTSFGKRAIPSYHFDKAKVIVSIGADFLGTWLSPVEFARQYAAGRRVSDKQMEMSKHIHFESHLSMTGANADDRYMHRPSQAGAVILNLYKELGGAVSAPAIEDKKLAEGIKQAAQALIANKGAALVVCGSNDVFSQLVVNEINMLIGANGTTINWATTVNYRLGSDSAMNVLLGEMEAGNIGALLIYGANPVYNHPMGDKFAAALSKIGLTVSFNERVDETAARCKYVLPAPHFLESWGDAEAKPGYISFIQPTIAPLFKTRAFGTALLKWSGASVDGVDYETYFKNFWITKLGSQEAFDAILRNGVIEPAEELIGGGTYSANGVPAAVAKLLETKKGGKAELVIYESVAIGDGKMANNPWLQELPDPITRATWDNYAMISKKMADELGIVVDDNYEVEVKKPVIKVKAGNKEITIPILVIPGMHPDVIAIAAGYGRGGEIKDAATAEKAIQTIGRTAAGTGVNVYPLVSFNGSGNQYFVSDVSFEKTTEKQTIAYVQSHNVYEDRTEVIKEISLAEYKATPQKLQEAAKELREKFGEDFRNEATLYDPKLNERPGIHWGMSIDLNTCTGCAACVVACTAENNVPVVGRKQVARFHEMHWLRIDRYYAANRDDQFNDINVVFQPMLCQHCDNAPCENVCPVAATNHSSEGLNQMTYNRCIGTRYCANNCPYKVRRFNWLDWNGADSFPDNQRPMVEDGYMDAVVLDMNDDLIRMVLNPDVTVRSRGVIEKCSFCVQRLQEGKLNAKKESRPVKDGEVKTACMQACPTNAIVFGNVNDKESLVYKIRNEEQKNRSYYTLESIHTLPNVSYLAKVRNTDRHVGVKEEGEHQETKAETKEAIPSAH
ncbi:MAG TPA: TAT-variant-translocated molybdopterin oxidoreductase [Chitinophagaceae bacterium]|nr:TAT-variant-translocated molybdopterin oxidoreductase [Chitinophagaceae bacterium]